MILVAVFISGGVVVAQNDGNSSVNSVPVVVTSPIVQSGNESGAYAELDSGGNKTGELDSGGGKVGELDSGPDSNNKSLIGLKNPLKVKTIGGLVQTAVEVFSYIVIIFAVLAFIWVGLQYILARGNSEKMKEMSKWLGYIVIGVAVVIGARVIISIVINTLSSTGIVDERIIKSSRDALDGN